MSRFQELAMKIVDVDATPTDRPSPDVSSGADTEASPGLRPEVLSDAAQRRMKELVHAALFRGAGEAPTIGPYQVLKRIGEGGMGVVYAAYDDKLERKVALKLLRGAMVQRPESRARTLREARALARLSHPNVVHVYQVGEVDDEIFVAMEFLTGPTLRAWLTARPRTWREVLDVFRQAGEGLAAAHRQGVIHRDFKPSNVIVGDDGRVRVVDFGLAHFGDDGEAIEALPAAGPVHDALLTQTGAVLGTPAYMAAEQFAGGRGDAKTDQFSFCTALYEALHGQRPFAGDTLETLVSAVLACRLPPPKPDREVPAWLNRVVVRGLQPDPAARWPSMDALLAALSPPQARAGRLAAVAASTLVLLAGGAAYATLRASDDTQLVAEREATAQARAEATRAQDEKLLLAARAALTRDPVETIRALAKLAGDAPATWDTARFLTTAAQARGLPEQVLRAERPLAEVRPLAGGGLVGRDELGAVVRLDMSARTGTEVLPAGAATRLLTASRAPVWAAVGDRSVQVFTGDRSQTIDTRMIVSHVSDWRLSSDGRTLLASVWMRPNTQGRGGAVYLWDLERPGSAPQEVALPPETLAAISADASALAFTDAEGLRVVRPREGTTRTLPYRGQPRALSADGRFAVAWAFDRNDVLNVIELATGKTRRVEASDVALLGGSDVLFTRPLGQHVRVWRESLATGTVAWGTLFPTQGGRFDEWLIVDPVHERFAAAIGDDWGVGDLRRGELTTFMTVPKDRRPQWAGPDALIVAIRDEVRLHRTTTAPAQMREQAWSCALAPGGRWAATLPWDVDHEEFSRIELTTRAKRSFRCPTRPTTSDLGGTYESYMVSTAIDDAGQIAMIGEDGWSCWWDEQHGARAGAHAPASGWLVGLPRGAALVAGSEVEVWSGPADRTQRWTAAGPVVDLQASPSGALLAARSERGVQVLRDTGDVVPVITETTPAAQRDVLAGALAWSPDGARLAVLDRREGALDLSVWDVAAAPREVGRYDLKDSQGRPRNRVGFTPSGAAVALTDRHGSLLRIDLATRETQRLELTDLLAFRMLGETRVFGLELHGPPLFADFAAGEASPLTPDPERGGSTNAPIRLAEDGSLWTCAALGPGTLLEFAGLGESSPEDVRARIRELAAAL